MYKINIKVESNKVSIISKTIPITTNSLNTIKCAFDLPQEYEKLGCVAVFTCIDKIYKQMIIDNECIIPKDVLKFGGRVQIGVYAFKGEELIYSPEPTNFKVVVGSYTEEENEEEVKFTQTAFDKMIEKTNELYIQIKESSEELENKTLEINKNIPKRIEDLIKNSEHKYISKFEEMHATIVDSTDNLVKKISISGILEQAGQPSIENPSLIYGMGKENVEIRIKEDKEGQIFNLRMQNIELFKDEEIYEENGKIYYDKKWNRIILNGSDEDGVWVQENAVNGYRYYCYNNTRPQLGDFTSEPNVLCDKLLSKSGNQTWSGEQGVSGGGYYVQIRLNDFNSNKTLDEFKAYLAENPLNIVYKMKATVKTEITDENFIADFNSLKNAKTYYPQTTVEVKPRGKIKATYVSTDISGKVNLYNKEEVVKGEHYDAYGKVLFSEGVVRTPLLNISKFNKISVKNIGGGHCYTFFDETKKYITGFKNTSTELIFYIPQNAKYFCAALYTDEIDTFEIQAQYDNKVITSLDYIGKTMNCLGDSITYGYIPGSGGTQMEKTYPSLLQEKLGLTECRNYGISGSTLAVGSQPMSTRYSQMENADIVSVFGGTNDFGSSIDLGTISDTTNTTVYGALDVLCKGLIQKYPRAFIFFMTPLRRSGGDTNNSKGYNLEDVSKAIKEVCYKYSIPVLDLYSNGGFHVENQSFKNIYGSDGLHPSQDFVNEHLTPMIEKFIRANY